MKQYAAVSRSSIIYSVIQVSRGLMSGDKTQTILHLATVAARHLGAPWLPPRLGHTCKHDNEP